MFLLKKFDAMSKTVIALAFCALLYGLSVGMDFVIIPLFLRAQGYSDAMIGVILGVEITSLFIISPKLPMLIEKFKIHKWLSMCLVIRNIPLLILPFTENLWQLFFVIVIFGMGGNSLFSCLQYWMNSIASDEKRGTLIGVLSTMMAIGVACAPPILNYTGRDEYSAFVASAGISMCMLVPLLLGQKVMPPNMQKSSKKIWEIVKSYPIPIIGSMVADFIFFSLSNFIILYGIAHNMAEEEAVYFVTYMVMGSILLEIPIGWLSDKVNRSIMMSICSLAIIGAVHLLEYNIENDYIRPLATFILAGSMGGIYTASLGLIGDKFRGDELAKANAAFAMMGCLGCIIGTCATGFLMDQFSSKGLVYSLSSISILYLGYNIYLMVKNRDLKLFE